MNFERVFYGVLWSILLGGLMRDVSMPTQKPLPVGKGFCVWGIGMGFGIVTLRSQTLYPIELRGQSSEYMACGGRWFAYIRGFGVRLSGAFGVGKRSLTLARQHPAHTLFQILP